LTPVSAAQQRKSLATAVGRGTYDRGSFRSVEEKPTTFGPVAQLPS